MRYKNKMIKIPLALFLGISAAHAGTTYQAEDYTAASSSSISTSHSGYTGSGFVDFGGNGSWIALNNLSAPTAGDYTLTLRYANGSKGDRQAAAIVNGSNRGNIAFAKTGGWKNWASDTVTVPLKQGNNSLRIQANTGSGGPNLDSIEVSLQNAGGNTDGGNRVASSLSANQELGSNQSLTSANGFHRLVLQGDGNLVIYNSSGKAIWDTKTNRKGGSRFIFQGDGNLVLRNSSGSAIWASGTNGKGGTKLVMQDDGNLVLLNGSGASVWSTNTGNSSGGGDTGGGTGGTTGGTTGGVKIAFIGDTGYGSNFQKVLNLIKSEKAELTIVAGDTSYSSSGDDNWDAMVRNTLGASDPALVVAGNHDTQDSKLSDVFSFGKSRLNKASSVQCSGSYGEKMTCRYKNIYFVLSSIGTTGSQSSHESFISDSLNNAPSGAWRVCAWHKNQKDMQVGGKSDETGWNAYETCREKGAIIATGHEHSYERTHLLSDMSSQSIASTSSTFTLSPGKTFAFVSGLGGIGIRDQERGGSHWAKIYTSSQGATYGAMFATFYENRAEFYFKNISGKVIDQFTVNKGY